MSSHIVIPGSKIASSHSGPISIEEVVVGPIEIENISFTNFSGDFRYQSGVMKNSKIRLKISPYIEWRVRVCIGFGRWETCYGGSGTTYLGTIKTDWSSLGDVNIASGKMKLDIKKASFGPLRMSPSPIKGNGGNLGVHSIDVDNIEMIQTEVPTGMPPMLGLEAEVPNMVGPIDATVQETRMEKFKSKGFFSPGMGFRNIKALNVKIDQARSGQLDVNTSLTRTTKWVNLAYVGFRLRVTIETWMKADNLIFKTLTGDVMTDLAKVSGFTMNLDIKGITLCNLKLGDYSIPTIKFEV